MSDVLEKKYKKIVDKYDELANRYSFLVNRVVELTKERIELRRAIDAATIRPEPGGPLVLVPKEEK